MQDLLSFLLSNQTLSLVLPVLVFTVTVVLVVRQLISFFMTLLFLVFALGVGVAVANYDVVREYVVQHRSEVAGLHDDFEFFRREIQRLFEDVQSDLKDQRQNVRKVFLSAEDMLDEMNHQSASLRQLVDEKLLPALERSGQPCPNGLETAESAQPVLSEASSTIAEGHE